MLKIQFVLLYLNYTSKKRKFFKQYQDLIRIPSRMAKIAKVRGNRPLRNGVMSVLSIFLKRK